MPISPHVFVFHAGRDPACRPLVLLHGSHGTESELFESADRVAPGSAKLFVRGALALDEGYAFFRRDGDRRVDEADLRARVPGLADLIRDQSDRGRFAQAPVVVGFSNGAIMAAALVATVPDLLAGAVLFRPLSPFNSDTDYRPTSLPVLIVDGARDHRRGEDDGRLLTERLRRAGASVTHRVLPTGHALTAEDEDIARVWLTSPVADGRSAPGS